MITTLEISYQPPQRVFDIIGDVRPAAAKPSSSASTMPRARLTGALSATQPQRVSSNNYRPQTRRRCGSALIRYTTAKLTPSASLHAANPLASQVSHKFPRGRRVCATGSACVRPDDRAVSFFLPIYLFLPLSVERPTPQKSVSFTTPVTLHTFPM